MTLSRRRFLAISAAFGGLALLPAKAGATSSDLHSWRGVALGADASLQIHHPDAAEAQRLIQTCLAEVGRLERVFSLFQADSALSRLNREGRLDNPPADLLRLLGESAGYHRLTGGMFDVSVQPLWRLYAGHFAEPGADPNGPTAEARAETLRAIGQDGIVVDESAIRLTRPGMALTLNGIAQGYITDRVTDLLRAHGIGHTLVDMGEIRALGPRPDGHGWQVGLEDPRRPDGITRTIDVTDRALATSGGYGTVFDAQGRFSHLFDPKTGQCGHETLAVSVVAPTATAADALSTALSLLPLAQSRAVLAQRPDVTAYITLVDGRMVTVGG